MYWVYMRYVWACVLQAVSSPAVARGALFPTDRESSQETEEGYLENRLYSNKHIKAPSLQGGK